MAVPGPPVSLAAVRAEFGAPAGTPLHAFVRGGAWVPDTAQNSSVPTAPPIRLAQLAGAVKYQPVTATAAPTSASGSGSGPNPSGFVISNTVTVTGHGGNAAYTYSWSIISGSVAINAPSSASTYFSAQVFNTLDAVARCTVSDGTTSSYVDVPVSLTYTRD
jgi:hypothetical protein